MYRKARQSRPRSVCQRGTIYGTVKSKDTSLHASANNQNDRQLLGTNATIVKPSRIPRLGITLSDKVTGSVLPC